LQRQHAVSSLRNISERALQDCNDARRILSIRISTDSISAHAPVSSASGDGATLIFWSQKCHAFKGVMLHGKRGVGIASNAAASAPMIAKRFAARHDRRERGQSRRRFNILSAQHAIVGVRQEVQTQMRSALARSAPLRLGLIMLFLPPLPVPANSTEENVSKLVVNERLGLDRLLLIPSRRKPGDIQATIGDRRLAHEASCS